MRRGQFDVRLARHNRYWARNLLQKLFLVALRFRLGLLQQRCLLSFNRKHSFARRQEHAGRGLQARIHVQRHVRTRRLFLRLQLFQLCFIPCRGRRFHLLRRRPVNHRRWNLFPSPALQAEVPHPLSIPRVLSHQLKIPVLQNQFLPVRRPTRQTRFALLLPRTLFHRLTRIRPRRPLGGGHPSEATHRTQSCNRNKSISHQNQPTHSDAVAQPRYAHSSFLRVGARYIVPSSRGDRTNLHHRATRLARSPAAAASAPICNAGLSWKGFQPALRSPRAPKSATTAATLPTYHHLKNSSPFAHSVV